MREIGRTIVSAIIFSRDGKVLMGRKDPAKGGVYAECWHIPGGGIDQGETMEQALVREVMEETGLDISKERILPLKPIGTGSSEKTLAETGEKVFCHMTFHRFVIRLDQDAAKIAISGNGEFVETRWFNRDELSATKQISGGREFFVEMGYMV